MDLASTLGWIATILFTICYIPQIMKTARTRSIEGLSFLLFFLQFVGNIVALWYVTLIVQPPLQVKYILAVVFLAVCLTPYIRVATRGRGGRV